jgi:hypothetical protein
MATKALLRVLASPPSIAITNLRSLTIFALFGLRIVRMRSVLCALELGRPLAKNTRILIRMLVFTGTR